MSTIEKTEYNFISKAKELLLWFLVSGVLFIIISFVVSTIYGNKDIDDTVYENVETNSTAFDNEVATYKASLLESSVKLCDAKSKQLRQKVGDNIHTQEDLILLDMLTTNNKQDEIACLDWSLDVLRSKK